MTRVLTDLFQLLNRASKMAFRDIYMYICCQQTEHDVFFKTKEPAFAYFVRQTSTANLGYDSF